MSADIAVHFVKSVKVKRMNSNGTNWLAIEIKTKDGDIPDTITLFHDGTLSIEGDVTAPEPVAKGNPEYDSEWTMGAA